MSSFGQDFLKGFTEVQNLRDYTHASRVFRTNAYELKPRFKFLFHTSFTINVEEIPALKGVFDFDQINSLSLAVKTVDLPKYNIQNETLNQYNRKRVVQTRLDYDPITITFHDDSGDNIRRLWYYYYSYYFKDPAQQYLSPNNQNGSMGALATRQAGFGYNARDIYNDERVGQMNDWGYVGEAWNDGLIQNNASGKPPFFRDIRIYGMDQHKYAQYVLINPIITNWSHDQYDYAQGNGMMQNSMTVKFETVKYYNGAIGKNRPDVNVQGFADPAHYDTRLSPIARAGSNATIFGQGGLLETGEGILEDLESGSLLGLIGAAQKAGTAVNTWKNKDLKSVALNEVQQAAKNYARSSLAGDIKNWVFPKGP